MRFFVTFKVGCMVSPLDASDLPDFQARNYRLYILRYIVIYLQFIEMAIRLEIELLIE